MSDTVIDIFQKPGVPYSDTEDVYSTTTIGAALPTIELESVVNYHLGGGEPAPIPDQPIEFDEEDPIPDQPDLTEGEPFELDITPHFIGGFPAILYEVHTGTLPPGLALNGGTGIVSGTPTTAGNSNVVFKGTDSRGNSANSNSVLFTVAAAFGWASRSFSKGSDSINATIPAGSVGDILVAACYFSMDSNSINLAFGMTGWNIHFGLKSNNMKGLLILSRVATGSDALTVAGTGSYAWGAVVLRFPAGSYNLIPSYVENSGTGTSADPLALTIAAAANLFLAFVGAGNNGSNAPDITGYPSSWANTGNSFTAASASVGTLGMASLASGALTVDPGAFTIGASSQYRTQTVAMRTLAASSSAPTYVGAGTGGVGFGDVTATIPGGVLAGDLLIGAVTKNSPTPCTVNTGTSGTGWNLFPFETLISGTQEYWYKVATGSDASLRLTSDQWTNLQVFALRGASVECMQAVYYETPSGSTTPQTEGIVPISGSREYLVLCAGHNNNSSATRSAIPSGFSNGNTPALNANVGSVQVAWKTATAASFAAAQWTYSASTTIRGAQIVFWGAPVGTDPLIGSTRLLLNGATGWTDQSPVGQSPTFSGTAPVASGGNIVVLQTSGHAEYVDAFASATDAMCWEMWVEITGVAFNNAPIYPRYMLCVALDGSDTPQIGYAGIAGSPIPPGTGNLVVYGGINYTLSQASVGVGPTVATVHHLCWCRGPSDTATRGFINGVSVPGLANSPVFAKIRIGNLGIASGDWQAFNIKAVRYTRGNARYASGGFIPDRYPFPVT